MLRTAAFVAALAFASPAFAQPAPAPSGPAKTPDAGEPEEPAEAETGTKQDGGASAPAPEAGDKGNGAPEAPKR